MTLSQDLQDLIDAECTKANSHALLLRVQSGDKRVDFQGSAGGAKPDTRFPIASISKMFTATLIIQLADEGRIDLDQSVQGILLDIDLTGLHLVKSVDYGARLTVRHLLHQTSGLADYFESDLAEYMKRSIDRNFGLEDVLRMARALPPQATPDRGRSYYSDTNYQLLGAVIEAVTGQTFDQALQSRICEPLGLKQTAICKSTDAGLAIYHKAKALRIPRMLSSMGPDGGIVSTTNELLVFLRAFMQSQLFLPENTLQMRQWNQLAFPLRYGLGQMRIKLPRWLTLFRATPELIGHSGASGSFAFHAPGKDTYVLGTFNQTDAPRRPFGFIFEVLRLVASRGAL